MYYYINDKKSIVKEVQRYLITYLQQHDSSLSVPLDGIYGDSTKDAVALFQVNENITKTGKVDRLTFDALRDFHLSIETEFPYLPGFEEEQFPFRIGMQRESIRILHSLLNRFFKNERGIPALLVSANFTKDTEDAVKYFQRRVGAREDGIVSKKLLARLHAEVDAEDLKTTLLSFSA